MVDEIEKILIYYEKGEYFFKEISALINALHRMRIDKITHITQTKIPKNIAEYHALIITSHFSGDQFPVKARETAKFVREIRKHFLGPIIAYRGGCSYRGDCTDNGVFGFPLIIAGCNFAYQELDDLMRDITNIIKEEKEVQNTCT